MNKNTEIKIPYVNNQIIEKSAEKFRKKYWDGTLPIDIEKIIEIQLKIDIVPVPEMEKRGNMNALITSDWKTIYVDKDMFEDERRYARLRFSYAHEIGHYILHKNIYSSFKLDSIENFYSFFEIISPQEYGYLETQANKFASQLLAPRNIVYKILEQEIGKFRRKISESKIETGKIDGEMLKSYIAVSLSKVFGISNESMEIILGEDNFKKLLII